MIARFLPSLAVMVAAAALTVATTPANAVEILAFGQAIAGQDPITATENSPGSGQTTITATNAEVNVTSCLGCGPLVAPEFLTLSATSVAGSPAVSVGGFVTQDFSGSFSIRAGTTPASLNILSGTFTDAVFGSGTSLTLAASNAAAGQSVSFTSSAIPGFDLLNPEAISLSFADVLPGVATTPSGCSDTPGCTLASFHSSVSGTFSATPQRVPEPVTFALLGVGLLGLGLARRRHRV